MISNYISLDLVIERLNTSSIPGVEWNISELKEWTWEALAKIGEVKHYVETSIELEVIDGKAELPTNIYELHTVLEGDSGYNMDKIPGHDIFRELTYKTNAGYIFTDFEEGSIILQCYVFPVDEDNKPLIPDNEYFISAIYSFLRMKLGERLFFQGKIVGNQFHYLEKGWLFYCPAAKGASKMMSEDEKHSLKKKMLKPFPNMYRNGRGRYGTSRSINTKPR